MPEHRGPPGLKRILAAYTTNELGTWLGYVALAVSVYDHTHSAIAVAGLFVAARLLPAIVVPAIVARAETAGGRQVISGLYALEGAVAVALALLLWHFWLPAIIALAAVDGAAALAARALLRAAAARTGAEPEAHGRRRRAAAALNLAWTATAAIGAAIAGVAVAAIGAPGAMLLDAGSFLLCALLLLSLEAAPSDAAEGGLRRRLGAAWRHVAQAGTLRRLLVTEAVALVFFASVEPVEILFAKGTLHAGDRGYGALMAAWGVGMVLGGTLFARARRVPLATLLAAGTATVGLSYVGFAASPALAPAVAAAVVGGIGNGVQWASLISAVQELTPDDLQGRLMAAVEATGALAPSLGFVLGGVLAALADPRTAFAVAGGAALAASVTFVRLALPAPAAHPLGPPSGAPAG